MRKITIEWSYPMEIENILYDERMADIGIYYITKYSLQGTTQGNGLTGADMPVRFSM